MQHDRPAHKSTPQKYQHPAFGAWPTLSSLRICYPDSFPHGRLLRAASQMQEHNLYDDYDYDEYSMDELNFSEDPAMDYLLEDALLEGLHLDEYSIDEPDIMLDVPYVPTDEKIVDALLDLAEVTSRDTLYDLGCGDGRIVVAAAMQRNTRGIGIDLDPMRIAEAMEYAGNSRVEHMVDFFEGDLLEADFKDATVVTLYLLDIINLELRPRLQQELQPGTRIVSHAFDMGDWQPDERTSCGGVNLFKWIVPARIAGNWQWRDAEGRRFTLQLKQKHQKLSGMAQVDGQPAKLASALLQGDLAEFRIQPSADNSLLNFVMRYKDDQLVPLNTQLQPEPAVRLAPRTPGPN